MSGSEQPSEQQHGEVNRAGNERMRLVSGEVADRRKLVAFLYLLIRDHVLIGTIEELLDVVASAERKEWAYTNGWLARWAQDAADRLQSADSPQGEAT